MPTLLPKDSEDNVIPAVRLRNPDGAHSISVTNTSARNSTAFDSATRVVSLYATVPMYVRFGGSGVTAAATDHYFPANVYYDFAIGGGKVGFYTHIAALRATAENGTLYISEKE